VADEGWKLLPSYRFDPDSGIWTHRAARREAVQPLWAMLASAPAASARASESVLAGQLDAARRIIAAAGAAPPDAVDEPALGSGFERIRWFPLPAEALTRLRGAAARLAA
jgi:hypothetical protein